VSVTCCCEREGSAEESLGTGSDTTSNSSCAILYYLTNNPRVVAKLLEELSPVAEEKGEDILSFSYEDVKDLPYLQACIDEALRLHSTSAIGLPRIVPEGGAMVCDEFFPGGMTLSVPVRSSEDRL
jgi:benzoate 4-monooxygenase